jgi:YD repeat-containing protein
LVTSLLTTNGALAGLVSYGLDPMGNRTNVTGTACSGDYILDSASPPADFQMNQYTASPCESFSYDDNGNLVSRASAFGPLSYEYDYANRLVAVETVMDDGSGTGTTITNVVAAYTYDALGRRASKTVYAGGLPPSTRQYCYDGTCAIEERENGLVAASSVSSYRLCYTVNEGLTWRQGAQDYYLHTDDQGNTLALTDSGGAVVERYDYDDYGTVTFLAADGSILIGGDGMPATSSTVGNPFLFHGMEWDPESGLYCRGGGKLNNLSSSPLYEGKGRDGQNPLYDSKTGREVSGGASSEFGDNPWSGGGGGGGGCGGQMKKGTVKFFNDTKGFGMVTVDPLGKTHTKTGHVTLMK